MKQRVRRRNTIKRLFVQKFTHYATQQVYEEFFTKTKNYFRYVEFCKKDRKTYEIQQVLETFEKKKRKMLANNIRRWRRNQFEMRMGKNLFRRLTRRAFCSRYEGMFYAWKL